MKLKILRYIPCCLLFSITSAYSENKYPLEDSSELTTDLPTYSGTCDDLKPVTSFKDFFLQLYSHLDDDCLYVMSNKTLAEKLGVQVLTYSRDNLYKNSAIFDSSRSDRINDAIFIFRKEPTIKEKTVHIKKSVQLEEKTLGTEPYMEKIRKQGYEFYEGSFDVDISNHYLNKFGNPFINDFPENLPPDYKSGPMGYHWSCYGRSKVKELPPNYGVNNFWRGKASSQIIVECCSKNKGKQKFIKMSMFKQLFYRTGVTTLSARITHITPTA